MISVFGPRTRQGLLLVVQITLMLALCGFILALADRHNRRFDLTPLKTHVISQQSRKIAAGIKDPVRIRVFFDGRDSGRRRQLADVLDQFTAVTSRIEYWLYDLDRTPSLAKKYGVSSYNTGVVEGKSRTVPLSSVDEFSITAALLKATRERPRTLCFVTGHGEHSPMDISDRSGYSAVAKELEGENFAIRTFELVPTADKLAACTLVILAGPDHDLLEQESGLLAAYLHGGGKVFLLTDPQTPASVAAFAERFGVRLGRNLMVDERNRLYGADAFMVRVPIFDEHTFRTKLQVASVFPVAQSLDPVSPPPPGVTVSPIALSSPDSWARVGEQTPPDEAPRFRPDQDRNGPLPVAMTATLDATGSGAASNQPAGTLAIFGDADFAANLYLNLMGNKDLFMSMVGVLAEDPELVAARRKGLPRGPFSPIYLTATQGKVIFSLSVVVVPAVVLLTGLVTTFRRRWRTR